MADAPTPLQLDLDPHGADPARFRAACRMLLGLDARAADALHEGGPLTLHLLASGDLGSLQARLERDLHARVQASRLQSAPCSAHPRFLVNERCRRCEQLAACALCLHATREKMCASCARSVRRARRFRNARIAVLLLVLIAVASTTFATRKRLRSWREPLRVSVVPVIADPDPRVESWARSLPPEAFTRVGVFLQREGARYGQSLDGRVEVQLAPPLTELPPAPPEGGGVPQIAAWSLRLRAWAWQVERSAHLPPADVRLFLVYHPVSAGQELDASVGLEQGHVGIVQAPIGNANHGWVELAVAHELLHTLGATDKYDEHGLPRIPEGLGEPDLEPTLPQRRCEVMAGRVVLDVDRTPVARSLDACAVNRYTASEIGWIRPRP